MTSVKIDEDVRQMLDAIGVLSIDDLFAVIPANLRFTDHLPIAPGVSEYEVFDALERVSLKNKVGRDLICFAGGGAYDHDIPAAVKRLMFRGEFVTAYTPYQPEVSQGVLQALFEFQTFVSRLFGLPIANASLYDGATALVEAINIACAVTNKSKIVYGAGINPNWIETARTYGKGQSHTYHQLPTENGVTKIETPQDCAALVVQYPNYYGNIEDLEAARQYANDAGALLIVAADIVSLGLLKPPGKFGADIVIGEGQPFGTPVSFGGPYLGLLATTDELVRRVPGRLVGKTVDSNGAAAYVTTLRTREQDIRREKASSNICTNQTLIAVGFAIYASLLGTDGFAELAQRCFDGTHYLAESLEENTLLTRKWNAPFVRECVFKTPIPAKDLIHRMGAEGFLAGSELSDDDHAILMSVTEKRTKIQIDEFVNGIARVVRA